MLYGIAAKLDIGSASSGVQTGLSNLHGRLLILNGLLEQLDILLHVEDFLENLLFKKKEQTYSVNVDISVFFASIYKKERNKVYTCRKSRIFCSATALQSGQSYQHTLLLKKIYLGTFSCVYIDLLWTGGSGACSWHQWSPGFSG